MSKYRWFERRDRVAHVTILAGWQMTGCPDSIRIVGDEPAVMATFATTAETWMNSSQECSRCKTTTTRILVAYAALILCRDMITCLAYGSSQNVIGIAIMAGFTTVGDACVNEAVCWLERGRSTVAQIAILLRR